jgi:hypothetical protein
VPINKRLDSVVAGITTGIRQDSLYVSPGLSLSTTGIQTNTLPPSGAFPIAYSTGWVRVKIYNGGGTGPTVAAVKILVGDGTNSVLVDYFNPSLAHGLTATAWYDRVVYFLCDVASTGAGGGATGQLIALNGVNVITVQTTLAGTSPTASMDMECLLAI